ncbi:MAG TPA: glycosyltransferase family 4 protein, partial [Candidatus Dormibacteraeota bacterium]|nr:glycosyltransferase family 4 protein [Candidatus Dormibacteraeota bacterium]
VPVRVCSARRGPPGQRWKVPQITGRAPLDFSLSLRWRLPAVAAAWRPRLWHALGGPGGVLLTAPPPGAPLVYSANHTYHTAHRGHWLARPLMALEARAYRAAAALIAISPSTASSLSEGYGIPADRIAVIPPGIDLELFHPCPPGEPQASTVLFVGRLAREKGVLTFLRLAQGLLQERPGARVWICGDGPERARVRQLAARWPGRVASPGRVDDEILADRLRRATVLVMPSAYEGLGLVALEALASGTPVVAPAVPGLRDLAPAGVVLTPPGDPAMLAKAVRGLLDDPGRRTALGLQGRQYVAEHHSWPSLAAAVAEVYRAVAP